MNQVRAAEVKGDAKREVAERWRCSSNVGLQGGYVRAGRGGLITARYGTIDTRITPAPAPAVALRQRR